MYKVVTFRPSAKRPAQFVGRGKEVVALCDSVQTQKCDRCFWEMAKMQRALIIEAACLKKVISLNVFLAIGLKQTLSVLGSQMFLGIMMKT